MERLTLMTKVELEKVEGGRELRVGCRVCQEKMEMWYTDAVPTFVKRPPRLLLLAGKGSLLYQLSPD